MITKDRLIWLKKIYGKNAFFLCPICMRHIRADLVTKGYKTVCIFCGCPELMTPDEMQMIGLVEEMKINPVGLERWKSWRDVYPHRYKYFLVCVLCGEYIEEGRDANDYMACTYCGCPVVKFLGDLTEAEWQGE